MFRDKFWRSLALTLPGRSGMWLASAMSASELDSRSDDFDDFVDQRIRAGRRRSCAGHGRSLRVIRGDFEVIRLCNRAGRVCALAPVRWPSVEMVED